MSSRDSKLGADFWGDYKQRMIDVYFNKLKPFYRERLMADNRPPFTNPNDSYLQYLKLLSWRMSNDPRFYADPEAQAAFAALAQQYGQPPPLTLSPLAAQTTPTAGAQASAGWRQGQGGMR